MREKSQFQFLFNFYSMAEMGFHTEMICTCLISNLCNLERKWCPKCTHLDSQAAKFRKLSRSVKPQTSALGVTVTADNDLQKRYSTCANKSSRQNKTSSSVRHAHRRTITGKWWEESVLFQLEEAFHKHITRWSCSTCSWLQISW